MSDVAREDTEWLGFPSPGEAVQVTCQVGEPPQKHGQTCSDTHSVSGPVCPQFLPKNLLVSWTCQGMRAPPALLTG